MPSPVIETAERLPKPRLDIDPGAYGLPLEGIALYDCSLSVGRKNSGSRPPAGGRRIRTCMGFFLSSSHFWFAAGSLFGAGMPFFIPSPAIRFAERAEGIKGPKR